jgi:electron-transferring-flavoprotein dehydrogenase
VPRIKGSHTAMKSGMLAAEAIAAAIAAGRERMTLANTMPPCATAGSPRN